ncbi:hypothetical protein L1987_08739 [Smallanthus sonchifolius]|uniref:Uncharacterized protein n=1 Tax=Smallanthus sonchifolius TaxID=185202 RepID=A0ACB9JNP4_9ASTR|nr:hypothetical protein L1987_08739 [Smallanthus sonchifolius]
MNSTIDKYKNSSESNTCTPEEINAQFYQQESKKLRQQIDMLQIYKRHLKGEGLDSLKLKELKQLETRLEKAISRVRSMKNDKILVETKSLQERIAEKERMHHEVEDDGYHAIEDYLARSALQLNIMGPFDGIPTTPSPSKSLRIW